MSFSTWINGFRHYIVSHQRSSKPKTIILALTLLTLTMLRIHSLTAFLFTLVLPGYLLTYLLIPRKTQAKRFILSLPLSLLVLFPLNTLSLLGIPLTKTLLSTVYLTINLSLFIKYRHKILSQLKESFNETTVNELLACLILILFIVVIWTPTLVSSGIPKAHGIIYYSRAEETIASLESNLRFPLWSLFQEMGYPIFTFDPPYYFQAQAIHHLMSWEDFLLINFNTYLLYALIILALSLYLLLRHHLKNSPLNAFIACLFLTSSNHLVFEGAVNGYTKMITAAPVFLALLSAYLTYVKGQGNPRLIVLISSALMLYYPGFLVAFVILASTHLLILGDKKFLRNQTHEIITSLLLILLITGFFLAPNLLNQKYTKQNPYEVPTLNLLNENHLTYLFGFSDKVRGAFDLKLTGFITLCAAFSFFVSRKKTFKATTLILVFLFCSFLIQTHPTISKMVYFRTANLTLLLLFIILFSQSIQILIQKPRIYKPLLAAALIFYLLFLLPNAVKRTRSGFTEYFPSGNGEEEIIFLKKQSFGRIISYDIYPHAIDSFLSRHTLKPALGGGFFQAHYSPLPDMVYGLSEKTNVGDEFYTLPAELDYDLAFNLFHRTFMKYVLVGDCRGNTGDAAAIIKT
ncbi:MAG: hypothetical protein GF334_09495, partial [Candidatus Altiarchaeales archaeon]|nr:hypothetical protein [Candidatus Altiarchaeales archaeon]